MKKEIIMVMGLGAMLMIAATGCGFSGEEAVEPTPVPIVTMTPTPLPTATPIPTPTPLPRLIGMKTSGAKCIYLTNGTKADLRSLYVKKSESDDWGRSLIQSESVVQAAELVRMYYTPQGTSSYDLKLITKDGNEYEIYGVELGDMNKASLQYDDSEDVMYLRYMSLSSKKEMNSRENAVKNWDDSEYDDWEESEENYYDDYDSSNDSYSDNDSSDNNSTDDDTSDNAADQEDTDHDTEDGTTEDGSSDSDTGYDDEIMGDLENPEIGDDLTTMPDVEDDMYDPGWDDEYDSEGDFDMGEIEDGTDIPWEE